jgi:hypothetical protein
MSERLPSVFIGSSSEGLDVAREVELQLQRDAVTTIWKDGVFGLGSGTLESLMNAIDQFDFAIMVLSPDDVIESRDQHMASPRDNVIFELGLFMGRLGRSRTFIVHEQDANLKLPTDLAGITASPYRKRENLSAALSPTCTPIIKRIHALGFSETTTGNAIRVISKRQEQQQDELSVQKRQIRSLQVALQGIVTQYEFDKLMGLQREAPFMCYYSEDLYAEVKRLRAMGLIENYKDTGLTTLRREYKDKNLQFDLRRFFFLKKEGEEYLKLRRELQTDEN